MDTDTVDGMATDLVLPVVVGVDGSEQGDRAVRFAVSEARRRRCGLLLVHAVYETAPLAGVLPPPRVRELTEIGRGLVSDARHLALDLEPRMEVGTLVEPGSRVGILTGAGEHASAIVLGHHAGARPHGGVRGSTAAGVAARAHCPVISVPELARERDEVGRVVVGVDGSDASHDALDLGFQEARRRGARLVVLHAWRLPVVYDGLAWSATMVEDWTGPATEEMDATLVPFRETYPDVEVTVEMRHELVGPALLAATTVADLVVVGRRGHGAPWGVYLGSLARMLIREGRCPVEVAPQHRRDAPTAEERLLGTADELSPQT